MSDDGLSIFDDAATGDPASTGADDATQVIPAIKDEPANAASKGQERTSTRPPAQSPARPQQSRQQSGPNQSGPNQSGRAQSGQAPAGQAQADRKSTRLNSSH